MSENSDPVFGSIHTKHGDIPYVVKDSGKREDFPSGMVRDTREGKGRYDLITPFALKRLAVIYEKGSIKYKSRNWEKGAPYSRFLDSALRHIRCFMAGEHEEDNLAMACWNLFAVMHFQELGRTDLDDMPKYSQEPKRPDPIPILYTVRYRLVPSTNVFSITVLADNAEMAASKAIQEIKRQTGAMAVRVEEVYP